MRFALAKNWWTLVLRGIVGVALGLFAFLSPGITLTALVFLFGAYALIDGAMSIAGAVRAVETGDRWGALLIHGALGIAAALITVLWPGITALSLVYVIAAWAILTGIATIGAAVRLRKHISGEWLLALSGIASIIFGVLIAAMPLVGAVVIALWFGAYAMVFGVLLIALGIRLRTWDRRLPSGPRVTAPVH
jgi:uncharacterized membrane protein HdeD (DUF308 family)